ncbi:MAG: ABC transporter permease [Pseudomonadales bacterium]|jgi:peptide/nickel transport system permease protein|nr:ABC transporter permease [Pseudomonadales bacterium]MDP7357373.1 ABC transporter permease [Pseudomonadales bacterium]MDP7596606.1 ABC transporter permease [Pseudomonadales bacterium]HJN53404.1 ABC transporter permease [Pseudomonadales bacterium]|tara:strand:+ start:50 stop:919 length:870 start_codon:yes stop_codon:yes gene_type:complete
MTDITRDAEITTTEGQSGFPFIAATVLTIVVVCAAFGPWLAPHAADAISLRDAMTPPAWEEGGESGFLLGTDNLGRDILSRIIAGARVSVVIAAYAILLSGGIGAALGMIAGYFGGVPDSIISRLIDVQMSVPSLPLALLFASVLPPGEGMVILVIVMTYWTWYARIVRGEVLSLRERDFIALAKVAGVSTPIIFIRHLTPNILNTMLVLATLQFGSVIVFEAGLSFLGLGIQPPQVSWGGMLSDGRNFIEVAWWLITIPGIAIMASCLASNILGDWLRDTFDPVRRQL